MSKERARRREERERLAAEAAAARRAEAERQARRDARVAKVTRFLPRFGKGQSGTLAAKQRQQVVIIVSFVIAINVLVWLGTSAWGPRTLALLLSVLLAPIAATLANRR